LLGLFVFMGLVKVLDGLELSRVAAETMHPTTTETTANEERLLKDSRQPRRLQRLVGWFQRLKTSPAQLSPIRCSHCWAVAPD
jgi:hypothetical protein